MRLQTEKRKAYSAEEKLSIVKVKWTPLSRQFF